MQLSVQGVPPLLYHIHIVNHFEILGDIYIFCIYFCDSADKLLCFVEEVIQICDQCLNTGVK